MPSIASIFSAGSPTAGSGRHICITIGGKNDAIFRFSLRRFNQSVAHIPRHQRRVTREGITIPATTRHFDDKPVPSWDNLQTLNRE
jgi:hypothetical protein